VSAESTLVVGSRGPLVEELASRLCEAGAPVELLVTEERRRPVSRRLEELTREGVSWLSGDPAAIDFGLSGVDYRALVQRTRSVILAFEAEPQASADIERSRLVRAAAEVLELSRASKELGHVTFLSSLLVFGNARGRVTESDFRVGQGFGNPHEETLAVAERIIRHAAPLAPVAVLRAAPLIGDAGTGQLFDDSAFGELVRRVGGRPAVTEVQTSERAVHLETSERAAAALFALWSGRRAVTAHLVDREPPSARELLDWVGDGLEREFRPPLAQGRNRVQRSPLDELDSHEARALVGWELEFDTSTASALFAELLDRSAHEVVDRLLRPTRSSPFASPPSEPPPR
jgi:nucleoside-diphosphate-sugar epimerase